MSKASCWILLCLCAAIVPARGEFRLASFSTEVTVPIGHCMMGGAWLSSRIEDPLEAIGVVLLGAGSPIVIVAVDWCEIRNDAFDRWQTALAEAAGTTPERVLVTAIHQHDAPVADLAAERLLRERHLKGTVCDLDFHDQAVARVARSLKQALPKARVITHVGAGTGRVEQVASNRRYVASDGSVRFDRMSRSDLSEAVSAEVGTIDPYLRTLSFWDGDVPVAALSTYAVHPMSYYGKGEVSADFPGLARRRRQAETPGATQIYLSGASGNVVAGKYNDGSPAARLELADRIHAGMTAAWDQTRRVPIERIDFRTSTVRFEPRDEPGFHVADLEAKLNPSTAPFQQCLAAMGLAWRRRLDAGHRVTIPCVDFGPALFVVLPGEAYVEYQLAAQRMRPDVAVLVAGYGEAGTGYIPTEKHIAEKDPNLGDWWWVAPGSEKPLLEAIQSAVGKPRVTSP